MKPHLYRACNHWCCKFGTQRAMYMPFDEACRVAAWFWENK